MLYVPISNVENYICSDDIYEWEHSVSLKSFLVMTNFILRNDIFSYTFSNISYLEMPRDS